MEPTESQTARPRARDQKSGKVSAGPSTTKQATAADELVGVRVRMRRQTVGMTQSELGRRIGVSFQQIQKYEQGRNRIGASRLTSIAQVLAVPVSFFFEELPSDGSVADSADPVMAALKERGAVDLLRAFAAIPDTNVRLKVIDLAQSVAKAMTPEPGAAGEAAAPRTRKEPRLRGAGLRPGRRQRRS
jgi:transcriptional regulator with XRE-family HTH domain